MTHLNRVQRKPAASAVLGVMLVAALLAGCGGSSKGSSSSSSSSSTSTSATRTNGARGQFAARASALRTCLQKNGIKLPQRKPGQRGQFGAGGLPPGVTQAQLQAAFKKCGLSRGFGRSNPTAARARFAKFSQCMSKNGIKLPPPNTSGKGPIFNTKGIDTSSAKFKAADVKCAREELQGAGLGAPGAKRAPGAAGPPGGAAPASP